MLSQIFSLDLQFCCKTTLEIYATANYNIYVLELLTCSILIFIIKFSRNGLRRNTMSYNGFILEYLAQVTDFSLVLLHRKAGRIPRPRVHKRTTKDEKHLALYQGTLLERIFIIPGTPSTRLWMHQNNVEVLNSALSKRALLLKPLQIMFLFGRGPLAIQRALPQIRAHRQKH